MLPRVDINNLESEVLGQDLPVLLACLQSGPTVEQEETLTAVHSGLDKTVKVLLVDEDSVEPFKNRFKVMGTPTFLLFHHGRERERMLGMADPDRLTSFVRSALDKQRSETA